MAYFRQFGTQLESLLALFKREERWLILVNADPDAMASALALKRIMRYKTMDARISAINTVSRPDNLAMIRYTGIKMLSYQPSLLEQFDRFALVDSQPPHSPVFQDIDFSVVVDHHPPQLDLFKADYIDIRPEYGATSTMFTEYLYNLGMRPGKQLATALMFGIKTDTGTFQRKFCDVDLRAYHYLVKFADQGLMSKITRSEFHYRWLSHFAKACQRLKKVGTGHFAFLDRVDNPDVLVGIADFFMRVYEINRVVVAGVYGDTVVLVFRGDGIRKDLGALSKRLFGDVGSAGGHKGMARAEFPLSAVAGGKVERFIYNRLMHKDKKPSAHPASHTAPVHPSAPQPMSPPASRSDALHEASKVAVGQKVES